MSKGLTLSLAGLPWEELARSSLIALSSQWFYCLIGLPSLVADLLLIFRGRSGTSASVYGIHALGVAM
jgi:glucose dehydrogenase